MYAHLVYDLQNHDHVSQATHLKKKKHRHGFVWCSNGNSFSSKVKCFSFYHSCWVKLFNEKKNRCKEKKEKGRKRKRKKGRVLIFAPRIMMMRSPNWTKILVPVKNRSLVPSKVIPPLLSPIPLQFRRLSSHFILFYFYFGQLKLSCSGAKCVVLRGHHIHQLTFLPSVLQELSPSSSWWIFSLPHYPS